MSSNILDRIIVRYQPSNQTIQLDTEQYGNNLYEIDLERCVNSSQLLDRIFQINYKTWATPEVMKQILDAVDEACLATFKLTAQVAFCPCGSNKTLDWKNKTTK